MKRPTSRRRSPRSKRNGVGEFGVRGHVVEVALGDARPFAGQVTIDPPNAYSSRTGDRDPVTDVTMAVALQSLAARMDPGWATARRRVVFDSTEPMSLSWGNGEGLGVRMSMADIVNALREEVNRIHPPASAGASHLVGNLEVVQIPTDFNEEVLVVVRNASTHKMDAASHRAFETLKHSSDHYRYMVESHDVFAGVRGFLMKKPVNMEKVRRDLEAALARGPVASPAPRASAAKAPRAARPIARKPAGRRKASAAARKPAPRKASPAKRRAPARARTAKRNGRTASTFNGYRLDFYLADEAPWGGQIMLTPQQGADPGVPSAFLRLATAIDPKWQTGDARVQVQTTDPFIIAWENGAKLRPAFPLTFQGVFNALERFFQDGHELLRMTRKATGADYRFAPINERSRTYSVPMERAPSHAAPMLPPAARSASPRPKARKHVPRKAPVMKRRGSARGRTAKRNGGADLGGYGEDIAKGARVRLSPHTDLYMMGAKYGTAKGAPDRKGVVSIRLDTGRTVRLPASAVQRDYR